MGKEFKRLHPETIIRVLYRLRGEIIREGQDGLEHVDALLRLRGADPEARRIPAKMPPKQFRRGKLRLAILRALQDGPRTGAQIVATIAAERGWTAERTRAHVYPTLSHMRAEGHIFAPRKDNRGRLLWKAGPPGPADDVGKRDGPKISTGTDTSLGGWVLP